MDEISQTSNELRKENEYKYFPLQLLLIGLLVLVTFILKFWFPEVITGFILFAGMLNIMFINAPQIRNGNLTFAKKLLRVLVLNIVVISFYVATTLLTKLINVNIPVIPNLLALIISMLIMFGVFYGFYICLKRIIKI